MATGEPCKEKTQDMLQKYHPTVLGTLTYLFNNPMFSDVCFIVSEDNEHSKMFYAHKFYLLTRSPVFDSMFRKCDKEREIVISDVDLEGFETMLRYLYTDCMDLQDVKQAFEARYCAMKYMVPQMGEQCEEYIISKITPDSVCGVCELALQRNMPKVLYQCLKTIDKHTKEVLHSLSFLNAKVDTLSRIVKRPNLTVRSEYELFKALVRWSQHECMRQNLDSIYNLRTTLRPLLPHIRFLSLLPVEFANIVEEYDIFEVSEAFPILMKLLLPNSSLTMPDFLNCKMSPRQPMDYFVYRPYISREQQPCGGLQENDLFALKFKVLHTDIFLLGISLPVLQYDNCSEWPKITTMISVNFIKSNTPEKELLEIFSCHGIREPLIQFPDPVYMQENETVLVKAKIQHMEKSTFVSLYRYQEMVTKFQQQDAEFILIDDDDLESIGSDVFQITSLRYYM